MKPILTFILFALTFSLRSQIVINDTCGTWEVDTVYISEWITFDTINYNHAGNPDWVYSEFTQAAIKQRPGNICKCDGCNEVVLYQDRISNVGIVQRKFIFELYKYKPNDRRRKN